MFYSAPVHLFDSPKRDRSRAVLLHHFTFDTTEARYLTHNMYQALANVQALPRKLLLARHCSLRGAMRNVAVQMWLE
jgi:hypothetical protein